MMDGQGRLFWGWRGCVGDGREVESAGIGGRVMEGVQA